MPGRRRPASSVAESPSRSARATPGPSCTSATASWIVSREPAWLTDPAPAFGNLDDLFRGGVIPLLADQPERVLLDRGPGSPLRLAGLTRLPSDHVTVTIAGCFSAGSFSTAFEALDCGRKATVSARPTSATAPDTTSARSMPCTNAKWAESSSAGEWSWSATATAPKMLCRAAVAAAAGSPEGDQAREVGGAEHAAEDRGAERTTELVDRLQCRRSDAASLLGELTRARQRSRSRARDPCPTPRAPSTPRRTGRRTPRSCARRSATQPRGVANPSATATFAPTSRTIRSAGTAPTSSPPISGKQSKARPHRAGSKHSLEVLGHREQHSEHGEDRDRGEDHAPGVGRQTKQRHIEQRLTTRSAAEPAAPRARIRPAPPHRRPSPAQRPRCSSRARRPGSARRSPRPSRGSTGPPRRGPARAARARVTPAPARRSRPARPARPAH